MKDPLEAFCLVLIASPSAAVRRRWKKALYKKFPTLEAATRTVLKRRLATLSPSILFVDLNLLGTDVTKSLHAIQRLTSATKIVVLASTPNETTEIMVLQAGARGYCNRNLNQSLIKKVVEMIQKGEIWVERSIIVRLLDELLMLTKYPEKMSVVDPAHLQGLTNREHEIACLVGEAASNKEIASKLDITEATVKAHLTSIFRKLRISDRLELALFVKDKTTDIFPS